MISEEHLKLFAVIAAALGAAMAGYFRVKRVIDAINHAVNDRQPGEPTLRDMVFESRGQQKAMLREQCEMKERQVDMHGDLRQIVRWRDGYIGGSLDSGQKVEQFVQETRSRLEHIDESVEVLRSTCYQLGCPLRTGEADAENCGRDPLPGDVVEDDEAEE